MKDNKVLLRNQMIYQVFVRQFSDTCDFKGLIKQLDRIKDLGFQYSTIAGLTISMSDVLDYKGKQTRIQQAEEKIEKITDANAHMWKYVTISEEEIIVKEEKKIEKKDKMVVRYLGDKFKFTSPK